MKRYIRTSWYTGEPGDSYSYGKAMSEASKNASTDYCKVVLNNVGWKGYYVTTPYSKYCLWDISSSFEPARYSIRKMWKGRPGSRIVEEEFNTPEEAFQYMEDNNM